MSALRISNCVDRYPVRQGCANYQDALSNAGTLARFAYEDCAVVYLPGLQGLGLGFVHKLLTEAQEYGCEIISTVTPEGFVDEWIVGDDFAQEPPQEFGEVA